MIALLLAAFPRSSASAETRVPCGKMRVLFLADSHALGPFGERMEQWLVGLPAAEVHTWAIGGSSPGWWFKGNLSTHAYAFHSCDGASPPRKTLRHLTMRAPLLVDLLKAPAGAYDRELVILGQGSNVPGTTDVYRKLSETLVRAVHADGRPRTCVWISPPRMKDHSLRYADEVFTSIDAGLRAAARDGAPCKLVDSRKYSEYPERDGDGVHYPFTREGVAAANRWADGVIAEIAPLVPKSSTAAPTTTSPGMQCPGHSDESPTP
ncbi:MAG: hypothetical protein ABI193_09400 [Minicystis sp.]